MIQKPKAQINDLSQLLSLLKDRIPENSTYLPTAKKIKHSPIENNKSQSKQIYQEENIFQPQNQQNIFQPQNQENIFQPQNQDDDKSLSRSEGQSQENYQRINTILKLRNRKKLKSNKPPRNYQQFVFPKDVESFKTIKNIQELQNLINVKNTIFPTISYYSHYRNKNKYIYSVCKECRFNKHKCRFSYRLNGDTYELKSIQNVHKHCINDKPTISSVKKAAQQLALITQESMDRSEVKKFIISKYSLTSQLYGRVQTFAKVIAERTFESLLSNIRLQNKIVIKPELFSLTKSFPDCLLIISKQMQAYYHKYWECIKIDFVPNFIRQRVLNKDSVEEINWYFLTVFSGLTTGNQLVIFGIAILSQFNLSCVTHSIRNFIKVMGKQPKTIFTEFQKIIEEAIQQIRKEGLFTGNHIWAQYSIQKAFEPKSRLRSVINQMIKAQQKQVYDKIVKQSLNDFKDHVDSQTIKYFHSISSKCCFSQIDTFVGTMKHSYKNIISHLLTNFTSRHGNKPYYITVLKVIRICKQINLFKSSSFLIQTMKIQQILKNPMIKLWRISLSKQVFKILLRNYFASTNLSIQRLNEKRYLVNNGQIFTQIKKNQMTNKWVCECNYAKKTRIHCSHLIKLFIQQKIHILQQLDDYWKETPSQKLINEAYNDQSSSDNEGE